MREYFLINVDNFGHPIFDWGNYEGYSLDGNSFVVSRHSPFMVLIIIIKANSNHLIFLKHSNLQHFLVISNCHSTELVVFKMTVKYLTSRINN